MLFSVYSVLKIGCANTFRCLFIVSCQAGPAKLLVQAWMGTRSIFQYPPSYQILGECIALKGQACCDIMFSLCKENVVKERMYNCFTFVV